MFLEGKGIVAPQRVSCKITMGMLAHLHEVAKRRDAYRKYGERTDIWGQGLRPSQYIPSLGWVKQSVVPILYGLIGEVCVSNYVNALIGATICQPDLSDRAEGDGGEDFQICGVIIDVKLKGTRDGQNLVRRTDEYKKILPLKADIFVFCLWNPRVSTLNAYLLGWAEKVVVEDCFVSPSNVAGHLNFVVDNNKLNQMSDLYPYCLHSRQRKTWR